MGKSVELLKCRNSYPLPWLHSFKGLLFNFMETNFKKLPATIFKHLWYSSNRVFFFGVILKSGREGRFWPFLKNSHGYNFLFTPTLSGFFDFSHAHVFYFHVQFLRFFLFFQGTDFGFMGTFLRIFTIGILISRALSW